MGVTTTDELGIELADGNEKFNQERFVNAGFTKADDAIAARREAAEAEAATRLTNDNTLQGHIDAEATTRAANDAAMLTAAQAYTDALIQSRPIKDPVRVVSTANITLSGLQTIDGVTLVANDRVLVAGQTSAATNGFYSVVSGSGWTRTTDADTSTEMKPGTVVWVSEGTTNGDSLWELTTDGTITLGSTALSFAVKSGNAAGFALDSQVVRKDALMFNVLDHGAPFNGTDDDMPACNALGAAVSAAGGGTLYFPPRTGVVRRSSSGSQASGLIIYPNVTYHFDNTTLVLKENCNVMRAASVLGTGIAITADTLTSDDTFTVTSSAGFSVGQQVFVELGQASYDAGEPDHWLWAKVKTIPDGTHVQLDRPCGYAMSVSATSNAAHRSIYPFISICENWAITGSVDIINPMTGSANAEAGLSMQLTRHGRVEKISGIDPGAGLLSFQYAENIKVDGVTLRRSTQQNGQVSKGNGIIFAESRNIEIDTVHLTDCQNAFIAAEAYCEQVTIDTVHIDNGYPGRSSGVGLFLANGGARFRIENLYVSGVTSYFFDNVGATDQTTAYFGDVTFKGTADTTITTLSIIEKSLNLRNTIYNDRRRWSTVIPLTPNMSAQTVQLVSGLVRTMRLYASSTTGITTVVASSASATGNNVMASLVAGVLVNLTAASPLSIGAPSGSTAINRDGSRKKLVITTDGTVPAGAYLVVELDYYRPPGGADDFSRGRIDAGYDPASADARYQMANPTLSVSYNPDGTVGSTTENGIVTTFTYNADGTVATETRSGVTRTFTYNADGTLSGAA